MFKLDFFSEFFENFVILLSLIEWTFFGTSAVTKATCTMYNFIGLIPVFTLLIKIYSLYRFRITSADSSFSDKSNIDNQDLIE